MEDKLYTVFWTNVKKPTLCYGNTPQDALVRLGGNTLGTLAYMYLILEGDHSEDYEFDPYEGEWNLKSKESNSKEK
jgi:hypothetical protein